MGTTSHNQNGCQSAPTTGARALLIGDVTALVGLAVFLLFAAWSERLRWFLAPAYQWFPPAAGVALIAMAISRVIHHQSKAAGCGCVAAPSVRTAAWHIFYALVLLIAVSMAVVVNPQQFSAEGIRKRLAASATRDVALERAIAWILAERQPSPRGAATAVLPPNPTVRDLLEAAAYGQSDALEGRFVTLVGQCSFSARDLKSFDLYRVVVVCCVADAQSLSMQVINADRGRLEEGQWVRVGGVVHFNDLQLPVLHAARIEKTTAPPLPYL